MYLKKHWKLKLLLRSVEAGEEKQKMILEIKKLEELAFRIEY